jgi:uncharacterized protein involved in cysteine biosynthesis
VEREEDIMMIGIVFLVFVAVLIPLTAIVGALYVGWLAERAEKPGEDGLREVERMRSTPHIALAAPQNALVRPQP